MDRRRCSFSFFLALLFLLSSLTAAKSLTSSDVRKTMGEMFEYHVEYKEFNALIARRALKIFVEQFDVEKTYLLSEEVLRYLRPTEEFLKKVIATYERDDLSEWKALNALIQRGISRARAVRAEIKDAFVATGDVFPPTFINASVDYAKNEMELKERILSQFIRVLNSEKQHVSPNEWTSEYRKKVIALWERRFARLEDPYLFSEHALVMHVLKAMAKSLDAHTVYFTPEEAFEMRTSLEKQFEGLGVVLREGVNGVQIFSLIKGGPAERSGKIFAGDMIVEINQVSMQDKSYEEVLKQLQGQGSITLGLARRSAQGETVLCTVELKREKIIMEDERVQWRWQPFAKGGIGILTVPAFYENGEGLSCEHDIQEALRALKKQGELLGLVIDLRENLGGFLSQAVKVAGLFISNGVIVISKYAQGETQYLRDLNIQQYYNGPLIMLTSKASASAAEIVAQALQDYGVALVVGDERTYGKGTIQYQTITDGNAASFFKVTVGRYYTVSGRSTQIDGVQADIVVPTHYCYADIGERYLEFPLKSDRIPSVYIDSLSDVPSRNLPWFQQNYLPNLQKKISLWTQMLSQLKENCRMRLKQDKDYPLFLKSLSLRKGGEVFSPTMEENFGVNDLALSEAMNIAKDMIILRTSVSAPSPLQK